MSRFQIECKKCGAHLITPILAAVVRFDAEHKDGEVAS